MLPLELPWVNLLDMKKHIGLLGVFVLFGTLLWAMPAKAIPIVDRDDWSGTYLNGNKLGFNHGRVRVVKDEIRVYTHTYFRLKAGGIEQVTTITQETKLTPDLQLKSFSLLQEISGNRQKIDAKVNQGKLVMDIATSGYQKNRKVDFPEGTVPAATVWLNMLRAGFTVGQKKEINLFVEPFQTITPMTYEVVRKEMVPFHGEQVSAYVLKQQYAGLDLTLWVTEDGTLVRELTAQGLESRNESEEKAQDLKETMSMSSFITLSLVKPQKEISKPYKLDQLLVKLGNVQTPKSIPQDHRQKVLNVKKNEKGTFETTVQIQSETKRLVKGVTFPLLHEVNAKYSQDTSQIQSNHPMIKMLAKELKADERDPWKVALSINLWVYSNLEKKLTDAFTAVDALNSRKGECQSHTNLFVALARAVGIPAKVVNGLVYSKEYKGFMYHAWPEVYVGEWRALDPTLGQPKVDATHIKLSEGNNEGSLKLNEFIGKIDIELVEN